MKDRINVKNETISPLRAGAARLRRGLLWAIFALVLMIPKLNRLRRRRRTWTLVRVLMSVTGTALLGVAAARGHSATPLAAGVLLLLVALILAPERPEFSIDARAKELGALIVVDGGRYSDMSGSVHRAKLFLAPDRLLVLDLKLQVLAEIPLQEIRTLAVEPVNDDWTFRVEQAQTAAMFIYKGTFGEHLARVAEATVRGQLYRELPVLV
jgi:hypothetical protein